MKRPATPHIEISENSRDQNEGEKILKNFSNIMKQVIDNQNDIFLNGEKNVVKYILAKYLQVPYEEISSIRKISIKINNDYGLLNQFGQFLPNLLLLKLNNSNVITMNNLGTSFTQLICLQMNKCYLRDLSGIICLQHLKILDVQCNEISDLIELEMSNLKKINLNRNLIADFDNLTFLSGMDDLEWINLANNPICKKSEYRIQLKKYFPNVEKIDSDEDIVAIFDEDGLSINNINEPKASGFISFVNKTDEALVNELNKVLEINDNNNNDDTQICNEEGNKEVLTPKLDIKEKNTFRIHKCLSHRNQNHNSTKNDGANDEEKKGPIKLNNTQRHSSNVFKKQTTKYQIDAIDSSSMINNHNSTSTISPSVRENRDNQIYRDINIEQEFEKDNPIIALLNNTKSQVKKATSLKKIEKEKYSITAKPLLQSVNSNLKDKESNQGNLLKINNRGGIFGVGGGKGKIMILKK